MKHCKQTISPFKSKKKIISSVERRKTPRTPKKQKRDSLKFITTTTGGQDDLQGEGGQHQHGSSVLATEKGTVKHSSPKKGGASKSLCHRSVHKNKSSSSFKNLNLMNAQQAADSLSVSMTDSLSSLSSNQLSPIALSLTPTSQLKSKVNGSMHHLTPYSSYEGQSQSTPQTFHMSTNANSTSSCSVSSRRLNMRDSDDNLNVETGNGMLYSLETLELKRGGGQQGATPGLSSIIGDAHRDLGLHHEGQNPHDLQASPSSHDHGRYLVEHSFQQIGTDSMAHPRQVQYLTLEEFKHHLAASEFRMKKYIDEQFESFREFMQNGMLQQASRAGREKPKKKIPLDNDIRSRVREAVRAAEKCGKIWDCVKWGPYEDNNKTTTAYIFNHVKGTLPVEDQKTQTASINKAVEVYFASQKAKRKKEDSGRSDEHRRRCLKNQRKNQKKKSRIGALKLTKWDPARKLRFTRACENIDLQSTDDTHYNTDNEKVLMAHPRLHESHELKMEKDTLDNLALTLGKTSARKHSILKIKRNYVGSPSKAKKPKVDEEDAWTLCD